MLIKHIFFLLSIYTIIFAETFEEVVESLENNPNIKAPNLQQKLSNKTKNNQMLLKKIFTLVKNKKNSNSNNFSEKDIEKKKNEIEDFLCWLKKNQKKKLINFPLYLLQISSSVLACVFTTIFINSKNNFFPEIKAIQDDLNIIQQSLHKTISNSKKIINKHQKKISKKINFQKKQISKQQQKLLLQQKRFFYTNLQLNKKIILTHQLAIQAGIQFSQKIYLDLQKIVNHGAFLLKKIIKTQISIEQKIEIIPRLNHQLEDLNQMFSEITIYFQQMNPLEDSEKHSDQLNQSLHEIKQKISSFEKLFAETMQVFLGENETDIHKKKESKKKKKKRSSTKESSLKHKEQQQERLLHQNALSAKP